MGQGGNGKESVDLAQQPGSEKLLVKAADIREPLSAPTKD
jgi:hypothetical protein